MSNKPLNKFSYRIYYEDTDAGGVVYYANYLKFFERARTDFLRELGINQSQLLQEQSVCFVVRKCEIEYISPAKLDDMILVDVEIVNVSATTITMNQKIHRDNKMLSSLKVEIVCVDSKIFKPRRISEETKNLIVLKE
jgi:acyl-CoA thioester hydrolase